MTDLEQARLEGLGVFYAAAHEVVRREYEARRTRLMTLLGEWQAKDEPPPPDVELHITSELEGLERDAAIVRRWECKVHTAVGASLAEGRKSRAAADALKLALAADRDASRSAGKAARHARERRRLEHAARRRHPRSMSDLLPFDDE